MGRSNVPARVRIAEVPADLDPAATDEAIAGVYRAPKPRRAGKSKSVKSDRVHITIQVTKDFKRHLNLCCESADEDAGAILEAMTRSEIGKRARRIAQSWFVLDAADDPPALPAPDPDAAA